jgi:hypothetical protein
VSGVTRAAWRSMAWPLGAWLEVTNRWTGALADGRPPLQPQANLLVEFAGGLARAFRGRRVNVELCGRRVRAEIDAIWLDRHDDRYVGRLELRSVECDGLEVEALSVVAGAVVLTPPPTVLIASGVEVLGRSALEPLVAWLDRELPKWDLRVAQGGLVEVVPRRRDVRFHVDAVICEGELEVELRAVLWRRVALRCPRWLRLSRKIRLPALPEGMSVAEARQRGNEVEFRLSMPTVRHAVNLRQLQEAIVTRPA